METVAFRPGAWEQLTPTMRETFIFNAPTWVDEMKEPAAFSLDLDKLSLPRRTAADLARRPEPAVLPRHRRADCRCGSRARSATSFEAPATFHTYLILMTMHS